jgi:carbon-monoxide dehydrogenase medium subunit
MKAAAFAWAPPGSLPDAIRLLQADNARALAGGQSLGPMLNLRAARPSAVVPLAALPELHGAEDAADALTLGAATTHAAIADGRTPDIQICGQPVLARIAGGIAYRAVRTRGTIGGSLCHADPAADWLVTLTALRAVVLTTERAVPLDRFVTGPFRTVLAPGEVVRAIRIPRPAPDARWGYHKLCRKPGEFAHAMSACLLGTTSRIVIGALGGPPAVLAGPDKAEAALAFLDPVDRHLQLVAMRRALAAAGA